MSELRFLTDLSPSSSASSSESPELRTAEAIAARPSVVVGPIPHPTVGAASAPGTSFAKACAKCPKRSWIFCQPFRFLVLSGPVIGSYAAAAARLRAASADAVSIL